MWENFFFWLVGFHFSTDPFEVFYLKHNHRWFNQMKSKKAIEDTPAAKVSRRKYQLLSFFEGMESHCLLVCGVFACLWYRYTCWLVSVLSMCWWCPWCPWCPWCVSVWRRRYRLPAASQRGVRLLHSTSQGGGRRPPGFEDRPRLTASPSSTSTGTPPLSFDAVFPKSFWRLQNSKKVNCEQKFMVNLVQSGWLWILTIAKVYQWLHSPPSHGNNTSLCPFTKQLKLKSVSLISFSGWD